MEGSVDTTCTESSTVNWSSISTPQSGHESSGSPTPCSSVTGTSWEATNVKEEPHDPSAPLSSSPGDSKEEEDSASVHVPTMKERFYFESDALALKNNPDYQKLLKTLAILEAQKMQAIKDMELLAQAQAKAERDPMKFVESLKNGTLEALPLRQSVAELPEIEWKGYMESLQQVAKQHSSIYINTRRQNKPPLIAELNEKPPLVQTTSKVNKPASYRQPWTPEEQARLEELLKIHPPEAVERKRFQKIAKALGTRTTQQVASHIQKYFIKLAHAGLPVPGRMPNMAKYTRSRKGKGRRGLRRPSTFFTSLIPQVFMTDDSLVGSSSVSGTPSVEGSSCHDDESSAGEEDSDTSELVCSDVIVSDELESGHSTPQLVIKCVSCGAEVRQGVYWLCSECPEQLPTQLCTNCINNDYQGRSHSPSHDLQLVSLGGGQGRGTSGSTVLDKDYTTFNTEALQTRYNYLDPNFFPANT